MDRPTALPVGDGERYVPLSQAAVLLSTTPTALRARIYRAQSQPGGAARLGFVRIGGRWHLLTTTRKEESS